MAQYQEVHEPTPAATGGKRRPASRDEVKAFEVATRDLAGVALRSIDQLGDDLSLPQFRLLLVVYENGPCSSVEVARALGLAASSVTRLADRLTESGHLVRRADPGNRTVVILDLSPSGRALARKVIRRRRRELAALLEHLDPDVRAVCAQGLRDLHAHVGGEYTIGRRGLVPL
ncbi:MULTISPECIES: MarR family winged helix-turn-helix transcriptional regulator [unclassified Mycolicibacterium]|uniref:MarR family winged helix-turn-helix transcriptional regulator n=1 Tax=unclassified Mycolicibacterium TaxID=2636767 RepID=UPI002EDB9C9D